MTVQLSNGLTLHGKIKVVFNTLTTLCTAEQGLTIDMSNADDLVHSMGTLSQAIGDENYRAIQSGFIEDELIAMISDTVTMSISKLLDDSYFITVTKHDSYDTAVQYIDYIVKGER